MAVVEFLGTSRPHPIQVLGKDLVLWRDGSEGDVSKTSAPTDWLPYLKDG